MDLHIAYVSMIFMYVASARVHV